MKFSSGGDSEYMAAFNFSSLTDIVMLLLIFFLLTSSFVTTKGLDVILPEASNTEKQQDLRLTISMEKNGKISFNDTEVRKEEIAPMVQKALQDDTTAIVVLRADESLPYTNVIEMLDIVKGAGANKFFLATDKPK